MYIYTYTYVFVISISNNFHCWYAPTTFFVIQFLKQTHKVTNMKPLGIHSNSANSYVRLKYAYQTS